MTLQFEPSASVHHRDFLVEAIMSAEQVPSGLSMYEVIFGMTCDEVREFLREALSADMSGRPLSLSSFRLVTDGDRPVGCCASWVESIESMASGAWIAMLLSRHLGVSRFRSCGTAIRSLADAAPKRSPGALQLESFFVLPEYRGRGVARRLITGCLSLAPVAVAKAEISLLIENTPALAAYSGAGFVECWRSPIASGEFFSRTRSSGFLQLQKLKADDFREVR